MMDCELGEWRRSVSNIFVVTSKKPALLCVTPHFGNSVPPAGAAALLSYLHENGCEDFGFVDFRTWLPYRCKTFSELGAFAETFVLDVPDLPIVLKILRAFREGEEHVVPERDRMFDEYCMRRLLDPKYVHQYLVTLERFFASAWRQYPAVRFAGFTTWTTNFLSTLIAAAQLKRANPEAFVVAGGPQVTESRNAALLGIEAMLFDAVVCGEGEQALLALYRGFLENGGQPPTRRIPGVLGHGQCEPATITGPSALLDLKALPAPRFDEFDLSSYWGWREHGMLPYQLSRGCTDKCSFCSEWVFWEKFRLSRPDASVEQIGTLKDRYKLRHIAFTDSLVNGVERRLEMFAENMLTSGMGVTWGGFMRAQMTPELAGLISRAGCTFAFVGVESLADETLDSMNKRRTGVDNVKAIEAFAGAGIPVEIGLVSGFPGDSRDRFMETVHGIKGLQSRYPGRIRVNVEPFRPTPNQPIYERMQEFGLEPAPWDDEILDIDPEFSHITGGIHCSVSGSNQGVDRLGEQYYLGKVIKSGPQPSEAAFAVGWGRPEVLDFEREPIKFRAFSGKGLQAWYSVRALHSDGSVRFLILNNKEVRALQDRLGNVGFGYNPFDDAAFADAWDEYAGQHAISGSVHPEKAATHRFRISLRSDDRVIASPYWTARVIDNSESGLLIHYLHDPGKTYAADPAVAPILVSLSDQPAVLDEVIDRTLRANEGLERDDVSGVLEYAHELGLLSMV